jgi:hypothetical protein
MSNTHRDIDIEKLRQLAWKYIDECDISNKGHSCCEYLETNSNPTLSKK